MIGIICAMDEEIKEVVSLLKNINKEKSGAFEFIVGDINNNKCVIVKCGVGKVHAAMCTQALILKYNPKFILNIGVAGSVDRNVRIGDIVVATGVIQHDFDISAFPNRKKGEISGINLVEIKCTNWIVNKLTLCGEKISRFKVHNGIVLTGDQFINSKDKLSELNKEFGGIACEMEAGSIAQTCFVNNVDFGIIRAISDNADNESTINFNHFIESSSKNTANLLVNFMSIKNEL